MRNCTKCGTELEAAWQFCGACGAQIPEVASLSGNGARAMNGVTSGSSAPAAPPPVQNTPTPLPSSVLGREWSAGGKPSGISVNGKQASRAVMIAAAATAFLIIAGAVMVHMGVRRDLSETRASLAATTQDLERTTADLDSTKSELTSTKGDLDDALSERDALAQEKEILQGRLQGVQGSLDDAKNQLGLQAGQISILKTCLNGVAIALGDVLNNDYYGAASALQSVRGPCEEAFALI